MVSNVAVSDKNTSDSDKLLRRLYAMRRSQLPPMGSRSWPLMAISVTLAIALMSTLLSLAWVQRSELDYLRNSAGVQTFEDLPWTVEIPGRPTATLGLAGLAEIRVAELGGNTGSYTLSTEIPAEKMRTIRGGTSSEPVVLSLPAFPFVRARVETTWIPPRDFVGGESLTLPYLIPEGGFNTDSFRIKVTLTPTPTQQNILASRVNQVPLFLAGMVRFQKYQDFAAARRVGSGKQLADIGRIVLAVFSVFLFIFIDSSAECLALGIFMGLKALGVVVSQRWLNDSFLPAQLVATLPPFLLSFADFMQLYFFTQLARLLPPRPLRWLVAGIAFGLVYTWGVNITPTPGGINWPAEVWRYRNILIGIGCLACSLPVAVLCWRDGNFHRSAALMLASSGVIVQIVTPIAVNIPGVSDMVWFRTWYNLFETHTPYVFALSTFINVSTLEQRVKALSSAAVHTKLIEREMSLGREVQEALFQRPAMPQGITLAFSHEPALYVSGDVMYANHDATNKTVSAVICDVTGHGVQAALKASICTALCESIWDGSRLRPGDKPAHRMEIFYRRAVGFFSRTQGKNEVLALVGCEVSLEQRTISLYRANAVLPMQVSRPDSRSPWRATPLTIPAESPFELDLPQQMTPELCPAFICLFSDGLIDSSRVYKSLVTWLEARLAAEPQVSAEHLKSIILSFPGWNQTNDDRTLAVIGIEI
ncbi:MAG: hypothetical protein RIQ81_2434 [Pseudomonadota bacterium]|jgi:hypothetical protein